jgi:cytoskeleton protein RodZ
MQNGAGPGALLRQWREAKGLSVDELARGTRIGARFLRALEEGRLADLPAPVFVRGFIRAYCAAVGASPSAPLERYEAQVGPPTPTAQVMATVAARVQTSPASSPVMRARRPTPVRTLANLPVRPVWIAAVLLVVVGVALYRLVPLREGPPPTPPLAPAWPLPPPRGPDPGAGTSAVPAAPMNWSGTAPEPAPPAPASRTLVVHAQERTWIQVRSDGGAVSEAVLQPGEVREWHGAERYFVTLGNAGGVTVELDGRRLPPLGGRGEIVRGFALPGETAR